MEIPNLKANKIAEQNSGQIIISSKSRELHQRCELTGCVTEKL